MPGPLWGISCQQDLQLVLVRGFLPRLVATLIFSVLALEVLNWLGHVNPKPRISPPGFNSASSGFGECTGGVCAGLSPGLT